MRNGRSVTFAVFVRANKFARRWAINSEGECRKVPCGRCGRLHRYGDRFSVRFAPFPLAVWWCFFSFPMRRAGCVVFRPHAKIKLVSLGPFGKLLQKGVAKMEVIAVNNELW